MAWFTVDSTLTAAVWDVKRPEIIGTLRVTASAKATSVGVGAGIGVLSVFTHPMTVDTACNALGQHLAEYLTGATLPEAPGE